MASSPDPAGLTQGSAAHSERLANFDIDVIRAQFPALSDSDDGKPRIFFDNPAGTQVPGPVTTRMAECMLHANANLGGAFRTSSLAGEIVDDALDAMAAFLNSPAPEQIVFGPNMTTLTFHLSRSIGRHFASTLNDGDEIIVTRMDHDANVEPWVLMARDHDLKIRWLPFDTDTYEFDLGELEGLLSDRTRLVCVGGASNLTGTVNDVEAICRLARAAGAWTFIDAVQSAPHVVTDVQQIGCDFLACSAYKFFGPHQAVLWGRRETFEQLEPYKVRPAPDSLPWSFAPGTASHEGMAGSAAAVDYFAAIGRSMAAPGHVDDSSLTGRRRDVRAAMNLLFDYEQVLSAHLVNGLQSIPGVTVRGITAAEAMPRRVPTVAFTHVGRAPASIAQALADRNIFAWSGHNYALELVTALGLRDAGGVVRIGPVHYNTVEEIDTLLGALDDLL